MSRHPLRALQAQAFHASTEHVLYGRTIARSLHKSDMSLATSGGVLLSSC